MSREELDILESEQALRRARWARLPSRYKSYTKGNLVDEIQEEFVWETNEGGNHSFATPPTSHRISLKERGLPLPECFKGDPNLQLTGGRNLSTTNKKKTIHYTEYVCPAKAFAEEKWRAGQRETTIIKDRDRKPLYLPHNLKRRHPHLPKGYETQAQKKYAPIHPTLATLLYLHDDRGWKFPSIAYLLASSIAQVERYYWVAKIIHIERSRLRKLSSKA